MTEKEFGECKSIYGDEEKIEKEFNLSEYITTTNAGLNIVYIERIKEFIKIIEGIMKTKMTRGEMVDKLRERAGDKLTKS